MNRLVSNLEEVFPSYNIIFKHRLHWSLGLRGGFRRVISADNPIGVREYQNVMRNQIKGEIKWGKN